MADSFTGEVLLDTYRILSRLGQGGMGVVYEAQHLRLPKKVAVEILRTEISRSEKTFARFRREAEIASSLGHSHIIEVLDFSPQDALLPFIVIELLQGESLATRLRERGRPRQLPGSWCPSRQGWRFSDASEARNPGKGKP